MYEARSELKMHFHICWSGMAKLDWEPFSSREEAATRAEQLARPNEPFVIEKFDDTCAQCGALRKQALSGRDRVNRVRANYSAE